MATTEQRIGDLAEKHLGISDRSMLDADVGDLGVNSVDAVSFLKAVNQELGADISPEQAAGFSKLRDMINHIGG